MWVTFSPGPLSLGHGEHKAGTDLRTSSGSQMSLNRRSSRREAYSQSSQTTQVTEGSSRGPSAAYSNHAQLICYDLPGSLLGDHRVSEIRGQGGLEREKGISQQQALMISKDQPPSFQVGGADVSSREKTGTAQLSLKPWQEEPAARTGREASAMQADPCSASSRYVLGSAGLRMSSRKCPGHGTRRDLMMCTHSVIRAVHLPSSCYWVCAGADSGNCCGEQLGSQ